jgi:hypothetical protein
MRGGQNTVGEDGSERPVTTIREIGSHPANVAKNSFLDLKPFGTAVLSFTRTTNLLAFPFSFFFLMHVLIAS